MTPADFKHTFSGFARNLSRANKDTLMKKKVRVAISSLRATLFRTEPVCLSVSLSSGLFGIYYERILKSHSYTVKMRMRGAAASVAVASHGEKETKERKVRKRRR